MPPIRPARDDKAHRGHWLRRGALAAALATTLAAPAGAEQTRLFTATGTVQAAFTPGDPVDRILIGLIGQAQRRIRVQIFSFTHKQIARALIDAHLRGVDVQVIADDQQDRHQQGSVLAELARNGVQVRLDRQGTSAHNKVLIIDAGTAQPVLVTGSYNFTWSAQRRNAENILVLRGNPALTEAFMDNWERQRVHTVSWRPRPGR